MSGARGVALKRGCEAVLWRFFNFPLTFFVWPFLFAVQRSAAAVRRFLFWWRLVLRTG